MQCPPNNDDEWIEFFVRKLEVLGPRFSTSPFAFMVPEKITEEASIEKLVKAARWPIGCLGRCLDSKQAKLWERAMCKFA